MELILQKGLPHQLTAVNAVCDVFRDIPFMPQTSSHQCPMLNYEAEETYRHIEEIQQANDISPALPESTSGRHKHPSGHQDGNRNRKDLCVHANHL